MSILMMMKNRCYYAKLVRVFSVMCILLIVSTTDTAAQETGKNIGIGESTPITVEKTVQWDYKPILIAWAVAIGIGVGVVEFWKSKMNTVFLKKEADVYIVPNSLVFNVKTDRFLYSNVTKIRRQQPQNRSR